ncbi:MAG: hypothetical protein LBD57_06290 [Endomicrobium sp.]|uniref:hypothetical protein n=1 Tax=Candidatus Endomicrobiellum cubanum TaxID=3242325 RepID=UPI00281D1658|nr:hypothetical protein [Endomicrobium sp.]
MDSCFCIGERESSKQKSVKEKLGWRMSVSKIDRKNDKIENSKVKYTSLKFMEISEFLINEKVSFNVKGLFGLRVYTHNELWKNNDECPVTSVVPEIELLVGATYFLTERFGIGVDLGYRVSRDINENRENAEKFDASGLIAALSFVVKFS